MVTLLVAHTVGSACSPGTSSWSLPGDGAKDVPTNALIYADGSYTLARADDDTVVATTEIETWSSWDIDGSQPVALQPNEPLDPDTRYALLDGDFPFATFRTGLDPDLEPPDPPPVPSIEATTGFSLSSCREERFVVFELHGDGALLLIDPDATDDAIPVDANDPFGTCCVYSERFLRSKATYAVERRFAGDAYRFGAIDQAGNWSGWGAVVEPPPAAVGAPRRVGCGCGTGPPSPVVCVLVAAACAWRRRR